MAVFSKADVDRALADLDQYYKALREAIAGEELSEEAAAKRLGPERYEGLRRPKVVIANPDKMEDAMEHLKATFPGIKRLKTKAIKPY